MSREKNLTKRSQSVAKIFEASEARQLMQTRDSVI